MPVPGLTIQEVLIRGDRRGGVLLSLGLKRRLLSRREAPVLSSLALAAVDLGAEPSHGTRVERQAIETLCVRVQAINLLACLPG